MCDNPHDATDRPLASWKTRVERVAENKLVLVNTFQAMSPDGMGTFNDGDSSVTPRCKKGREEDIVLNLARTRSKLGLQANPNPKLFLFYCLHHTLEISAG